jgi:hypothetical protein
MVDGENYAGFMKVRFTADSIVYTWNAYATIYETSNSGQQFK